MQCSHALEYRLGMRAKSLTFDPPQTSNGPSHRYDADAGPGIGGMGDAPVEFRDGLVVRGHFQAGVNAVSESNLYWEFADPSWTMG